MKVYTLCHYKKVKAAKFTIRKYIGELICNCYEDWYGVAQTRGKFAVFNPDFTASEALDRTFRSYADVSQGKKVYLTSKCYTPRDLVRNTYTIVRDKMAADIVCVPKRIADITTEQVHGVVVHKNPVSKEETLYMVDFCYDVLHNRAWLAKPVTEVDIVEMIATKENRNLSEFKVVWMTDLSDFKDISTALKTNILEFVPDIPEYEEVLLGTKPKSIPYIYEHKLNYTTPSVITPENLFIWFRLNDKSLLERTLALCDWKKYPVTFACFISAKYPRYERSYSRMESSLRLAIKTLNIPELLDVLEAPPTRVWNTDILISPEDNEMLQNWIFKELGLDGQDCGYVIWDQYRELPGILKDFLRKKLAIAKTHLTKPTVVQQIKQKC